MPSVTLDGSVFNFIALRGEPEPMGVELEEVTRPGESGHAFWEDGLRGRPFEMEGLADHATLSAAATSFNQMKAKQGRSASLVDDRGTNYSNLVCLGVEKVSIRRIGGSVGGLQPPGAALALLVVRFRFQTAR